MNWLALTLALAATQPAPPARSPVRLIDRPNIHLGVRPIVLFSSEERAAGVSVQLSIHVL